jgi:RIO kinase 1
MRVPEELVPLMDQGVIDAVLRPLMAGKEARVYLVSASGERRVAKVYKASNQRSFKHRADYTEGRKVRNTRQQRAMAKRSRYGRAELEAAWTTSEVDVIYRLRDAGVRVPEPFDFVDNVLVMELVADPRGEPAPRLVDMSFSNQEATQVFHLLVREVVKMLCAGVVHGDLSDFNVLMGPAGPVIIDFPQAVDPAFNNNARKLLLRDVRNLQHFLGRFAPQLKRTRFGPEIWDLYERSELRPDSHLTGRFKRDERQADTMSLLEEIEAIEREVRQRREALGLPPPRRARRPVEIAREEPPAPKQPEGGPRDDEEGGSSRRRRRRKKGSGEGGDQRQPQGPIVERRPPPGESHDHQRGRDHHRGRHDHPVPPRAEPQSEPPRGAAPQDGAPRRRRRRRRKPGPGAPNEGGGQ